MTLKACPCLSFRSQAFLSCLRNLRMFLAQQPVTFLRESHNLNSLVFYPLPYNSYPCMYNRYCVKVICSIVHAVIQYCDFSQGARGEVHSAFLQILYS